MLSQGLAPLTLLISQQVSPDIYDNAGSCLSYHGTSTTGRYSFFSSPDEDCIQNSAALLGQGSLGVAEPDPSTQLVWLEHNPDAFDPSLLPTTAVGDVLASLQTLDFNYGGEAQDVLGGVEQTQFVVLHADSNSALVQMDRVSAASVDMHIPPLWRSMFLPFESFARIPVPIPAVERVQDILDHVKFNPDVAAIVNNISLAQMKNDIRFLTGEDDKSGIVSRHSFSEGSRVAAKWLKERFEQTGAECTLEPFLRGFAPNVICSYPSSENATETIVLGAHYDSRGSFGSVRAPGGDDDGSGTVALLSIARTIARTGVTFRKNVQLCAFAGEEQGLLGSSAYARKLRNEDADITLMIQADMLAYHKAGEPAQLGLPDIIGTPAVTQLVANLSAIYSPELTVGFTPACCSDHQSFHEQGFPASQVFERAGPIADPMYHNSGDLSERPGYDFDQIKSIAKVQFATLLHAAGFDLPEANQ